ncbi:MAG: MOSC domain-containing protein, partial [Chloroflexi bacterium]|nr:MOSC domain-containing protein [Chloroflexota bacterium]
MANDASVGTVAELWRFPVKSMQGEQLQQAELTDRGLVGDRSYGLIDLATGKAVSAKSVNDFPGLMGFKATFVEEPRDGCEPPPVRIELPDGTLVTSDSGNADGALSAWFKREVTLGRAAPVKPSPRRSRIDIDGLVAADSLLDAFPVSVITTSTLYRLCELQPGSRFDPRRFRMNLVLGTAAPGFLENDWVGRALGVGDAVRLNITMLDPRCVMTTLPQDDLPEDADILRTLTRHNRHQVADLGRLPCAGVYAVVAVPGTIRVGDDVALG